jgi:uncharacterized membrane protein YbhN (UPF0104 family)
MNLATWYYETKMKKKLKAAAAILILLTTLSAFIYYCRTHPAILDKLQSTDPLLMILLVLCYMIWFLALVFILRVSLRLYGTRISSQENVLLNAYSTLVNFFGPGQSGPAFRGLYLKKRHGLPLKKYIFATLLYYGFYAVISAFFLFAPNQAWWKTGLLMLLVGASSMVIIRLYAKRSKLKDQPGINLVNLGWLLAGTAVQMVMQAIIFYIELRSVSGSIGLGQTLTYTGAANFALFVSLTPGAIGFREAFLLFSQSLHHISNSVIVAANIIDRAMYLVFLGVLFIMVLSLHAKDKLRIKQYTSETEPAHELH